MYQQHTALERTVQPLNMSQMSSRSLAKRRNQKHGRTSHYNRCSRVQLDPMGMANARKLAAGWPAPGGALA